jgi:hypothetical protein
MNRRRSNPLANKTFNKCVDSLEHLSEKLGLSYEELNVLIFVIGYPIVTIGLITAYLKK